jgi:hypothetical protein
LSTDELERALIRYIAASEGARIVLSRLQGTELLAFDIQRALCAKLKIDVANLDALLDQHLTEEGIIEHLREFDFRQSHPEVLAEFELEDGILPDDIVRLLTEKTIKVKGEIWRVHKNDADPFPSVPHAHNYEAGIRLHLGNGELFNWDRQRVGNIGEKKLKAVREKLNGIPLPPLYL